MKVDIIGDIHGCYDELIELLTKLNYSFQDGIPIHPDGRKIAFVGDAMDRGPHSLRVIDLLFRLQDRRQLIYSPGNHCDKLYRFAKGNNIQIKHGLETTVAEIHALNPNEQQHFLKRYKDFYEDLPLFVKLDEGNLIIAHAGIREGLIESKNRKKVRSFVLYGDTTGEQLPNGRPVRKDWAQSYSGKPFIVYGHTPVLKARFLNHTVNIDTGCVFGGRLTALRYPEMEIEAVPSSLPFTSDRFTHFE